MKITKRICRVRGCKNSHKLTSNVIFHKFPLDQKLRNKWAKVLKIDEVTSYSRICCLHFRKSDYQSSEPGSLHRLKKGVIPTQNLPDSLKKQEISKQSENSENEVSMENSSDEQSIDIQFTTIDIKHKTILDYIKTDTQLREFCGIPTFKLLYEIVKEIRSLKKNKVLELPMSLPHCVMLTYLHIKHEFSLLCLSALFHLDKDVCKTYFNHTINSLRALLYHTIEHNPENGEMIKVLMHVNSVKNMQNSVFY